MNRFRLFVLAVAGFLAVVGESFFKKSIAVGLCGILTFNSASCAGWGSGVSAAVSNSGEVSPSSTEIAIPPRIRDEPVDLQEALADDFGIVSQNPFSTGRNEILFTSPSTGVEQKYSVNLPGTGDFQLFEVEFNKVSVPNPEKLVGEGNSIFTADQVANLLQSFRINFQSNQPSEVIFADGSKAEFSNSSYVFKLPSGEVVDSVTLSQGNLFDDNTVASKARIINSKYGNYNYLASSGNACQSTVRTELNSLSKDLSGLGDKLKSSDASTKKLARWVLAFGGQSLQDSTVTASRNITMDEVACRKPVECGQVQDYDGGSEIRTDLFHLQPGSNRTVNLDYEFYRIPDRLEIYYNGEIRYSIPEPTQTLTNTTNPPEGFLTNGNGSRKIPIDDGVEYVGVKLIGNANQGTKWTYQISCSGEAIADAGPQCSTDNNVSSLPNSIKSAFSNLIKQNNQDTPEMCLVDEPKILGIDRWWATAGDPNSFDITWRVFVENKAEYVLRVNILHTPSMPMRWWDLKKVLVNSREINKRFSTSVKGKSINIGELQPGIQEIKIVFQDGSIPENPNIAPLELSLNVEEIGLNGVPEYKFEGILIADHSELFQKTEDAQTLINKYKPILHFDKGIIKGDNKPENYVGPFSIEQTWGNSERPCKQLCEVKGTGSSQDKFDLEKDFNDTGNYTGDGVIYASLLGRGNEVAINYYFHYPRSNWKYYGGENTHQGDWEGITVFLRKNVKGTYSLSRVAFSQHVFYASKHAEAGGIIVAKDELDLNGDHTNVYVGLGGHASYPFKGTSEYFTRSPQQEYSKGDYKTFENLTVKYLPRAGTADLSKTHPWLLYTGKWGSDESAPKGPMFTDLKLLLFNPNEFTGTGERWINPWQWSRDFKTLKKGKNSNRLGVVYLGNDVGEEPIEIQDEYTIARGGKGNDVYELFDPILHGDADGSFIEDLGGNQDEIIFRENKPYNEEFYIGLEEGEYGINRDGKNLVIDYDKNGIINYDKDVTIADFFNSYSGKDQGTGFIETINNLKGRDILKAF